VFQLAGEKAAVPLENVGRIAPMAELARPPGLPSALEGFLNLRGTAVPVLRLDRLLQLRERSPGLYSKLITLKGVFDGQVAILVDQVSEILSVAETTFLPVGKEHSFNACMEAAVPARGEVIHLLSPGRILLELERRSLAEFQAAAQRRLLDWSQQEL
jgi:purine-binding chemotaxis protein CheW